MCIPKGDSCCQAFLAETVETVNTLLNGDVSQRHALLCEEKLGKIDAKDVELFLTGRFTKALIILVELSTSLKTSMVRL